MELVIQNVSELAGDGNDATYDVEGPVVAVGNSEWSLCAQVGVEQFRVGARKSVSKSLA